ncbi:hypothetical protein N7541_001801 [Penicillium brevicompactum]|uniref:Uncharacterized protein n=1 Tax=Penicillium brevicompactum TaxID=5074 RepID=A0A9W9RY86_PENBR|nr:hypothetical protein N7541_001801 [Penicillium brevicompactum]
MSYNVYRVSYAGLPRDHHAIFVEMNNDQSGHLFQSGTYQSKEFIGRVAAADFARILPTCESIPPPKKQFEGARRLYPKEPLRRCQEWTQEAVNALVTAGILKK